MQKELTIIIVTYNSEDIIKDCLSRLNFDKHKIVVVDNASKDNTIKVIEENFKLDKFYKVEDNIGFGGGNNLALEEVDTEFALVLNPDAMIDDENIEIVLSEMKGNEKFVLAGPVVLDDYPYNEEEYLARTAIMQEDCQIGKDCHYEKIGNSYSVRFIIGCAMFFKMKKMKKIGFFDKNIFLFYEDDEICHRVIKNDYLPIVVASAKAFHLKGASSKKSLKLLYIREWNFMWSKMYWKDVRKGYLRSKRSSSKHAIVNFIRVIYFALTLNKEKLVRNLAYMNGAFCYFLGRGSFKENGKPRVN